MNKKIIGLLAIIMVLLVTGCSLDLLNTPRKQVETLFNKYQTLDANVVSDLDNLTLDESNFTMTQRERYKELMKKHYRDLIYTIKDEKIDGDQATVTVEIKVYDYAPILTASNTYLTNNPDLFMDGNNEVDAARFNDYRLERLEEATEKVTYTLDVELTKIDKKWHVSDLNDVTQDKINGVYIY